MNAEDVLELYKLFQDHGIEIWIDGGWGIDSLLGHQTRWHKDLDIALDDKYKPKLLKLLAERGYKEINLDTRRDWNFVMSDGQREIDIHTFIFDEQGKNIYGTGYPKPALSGTGIINGVSINCIPPEWVVKLHAMATYTPKEKDIQDVNAVCDKFGLEPPENYKK